MKTKPKTKVLADRHEAYFANEMPETTQTLASGAVLERHDARSEYTDDNQYWRFRSELKCTQKKSYSFKVQEWKDLVEYAALQGERPMWAVRFYEEGEENPNLPVLADLIVMDMHDYIEMQTELAELRASASKAQ